MASSTSTLKLIVDMVNNTEAKFKQISTDFDAVQKKTEAIRGALQQVAIVSGVAFAGLSAIILKSTSDYGEFNSEIQRTGAFVNATEDQIKAFGKAAIEAVEGTKFSALDGAKALGNFVGGEVDAAEASAELGDVINLALITRMDNLQEAVNLGSLALTVFKNDGMETTDVMDIMATVAADVTTQTSSWATQLVNSAGAAKGAGFSFKELNQIFATMVRGGANVQTVGTAVTSAFIAMQGPTKQAKEALDNVGISSDELKQALAKGPLPLLEKLKEGFEEANKSGNGFVFLSHVLGRQAAPEFALALGLTNEELSETAGWFEDVTGRGKEMTDKIREAEPAINKIRGAFEKLSLAVGGAISDAFNKFVEIVEPAISAVTKFATEHPKLIAAILIGITAFAGLILVATTLTLIFISLSAAATALGIGVGALIAGFLLIPAAIASVVVVVTLLIMNWKDLPAFFSALWQKIKDIFFIVINAIAAFVVVAFNAIINTIVRIWNALPAFFSDLWERIKNTFFGVIATLETAIPAAYGRLKDSIRRVWDDLPAFFEGLWKKVAGTITKAGPLFITAWNGIVSGMGSVWDLITEGFNKAFTIDWGTIAKNAITGLVNFELLMIGYLTDTWGVWIGIVVNKLADMELAIYDWFVALPGKVGDWLVNVGTAIGDWFSALPGRITAWFVGVGIAIGTWYTDQVIAIQFFLDNWLVTLQNWWNELPGHITEWFQQTTMAIGNFFMNLFKDPGVQGSQNQSIMDMLSNWVTSLESNKLYLIGKWSLIIIGIILALPVLLVASIATFVLQMVLKMVDAMVKVGDKIGTAIRTWFTDAFTAVLGDVENFVSQIASKIKSGISNAISGAISGAGNFVVNVAKSVAPRAAGGPVNPMGQYLVGEKGPELFKPTQYGRIIPNGGTSSGGTTININVTGNSFMGKEGVAEEISKQIAYILSRNVKLI